MESWGNKFTEFQGNFMTTDVKALFDHCETEFRMILIVETTWKQANIATFPFSFLNYSTLY